MLLVTGVAQAGLSQSEETRLSVEYEGERLPDPQALEIRELVSDNTLIFIHPRRGVYFSNGQTLNSWSQDDTANAGPGRSRMNCWTYPGGTRTSQSGPPSAGSLCAGAVLRRPAGLHLGAG